MIYNNPKFNFDELKKIHYEMEESHEKEVVRWAIEEIEKNYDVHEKVMESLIDGEDEYLPYSIVNDFMKER